MRIKKPENNFGDFPKKWAKILEDEVEFMSQAQQCTAEQLDKLISECQENIVNLERDRDADEDLKNLKEQVKEAEEPIKTGIKINNAKARFCIYLKKSLGKPVEN